jgi:hypothetical protein
MIGSFVLNKELKAATTEEAITGMLGPFQFCPRIG